VVILISGLLLVPAYLAAMNRAAARSKRMNCTNNLKQLGLVFKGWALSNGGKFPMEVYGDQESPSVNPTNSADLFKCFQVLSNEVANSRVLICPADNRPPAVSIDSRSNSNLSYFLGLDAKDTDPDMLLIGDRNLTNGPLPPNRVLVPNTNYPAGWTRDLHHYQGNIGLADGSVQQFSNARLREALLNSSYTNRLAIP
jgi:hypothetical protein